MDDISTSTLFIILGVLIVLSAYFSGSETGMMSVNPYRLKHLTNEKNKAALRVSRLLKRPDRLIGLILIGNNLVNIFASTVATIIGVRLYGDYGLAIAPIALTVIILIFAEVTPKTLAALHPEKVALPTSAILSVLLKVFYPFVWALNKITNGLLNLLGVSPEKHQGNSLSAEELRTVVYEAGALIPEQHQNMLVGVLDLENATVEDIMIPRNEIVGIDINDEWKDIERQLANFQYSRILLFRDNIDDAIGFVHPRELMRLLIKEQLTKASLLRAASEVYFIPEGTPLNTQLLKFQGAKDRIGLVVDEYGDIQGLVTLADILEEVVGEFTTDIAEDTNEDILAQPDGTFLIDGSINLRDLNREMKMNLPTDGPKTLNGLILEYLEEIPQGRLSVKLAGYPMEIVDVQDNMIKTIRLLVNPKKAGSKKPAH
ncbi:MULTISPECIES: HlyC/CorC family transporter [unclassified Arsukibacterium]|uniref:HlyC/CorC family transporter n=1 Tax=unclassified Arsukibacterium TaxID=2635278 RepID=UPI000C4208CD|nr:MULTISPECIES: HlyC/CorC family transporter [unclassified Arsukibacterium]MAA96258.1 magnesium/cobalt efflux protein [Rheinheimera sp.]MBM35228.1 magnesium/cobalt efflux protein [Rheinheimera sp.]HAW94003.1 magnesium/cobalt efflux protein [Candidatus Azambacteria bacterium]